MKTLRNLLLALAGACLCVGPIAAQETAPDKAFVSFAQGMGEGRLEVVWQMLPASYQKDVTTAVSDFAGKMDGELWNQSIAVSKKLVKVLKEKKDFILANPNLAALPIDKESLSKGWTPLCEMLETIVESDLADVNKLKNPDVEKFLKESGSKLLKQMMAVSELVPGSTMKQDIEGMKTAKAEVVKSEGDKATLKVTGVPKAKDDNQVVRVEGKWIPKEMADGWAKGMADVKQKISEIKTDDIAKAKPMLLGSMKKVEESLDKLAAAKSQGDFEAELGNLMQAAQSLGGAGG